MPRVASGYEDFIGGEITSIPNNDLKPNQLSLAENVRVTDRDKPGVVVKRNGYTKHWDESGTFTGEVIEVHNFLQNDGTELLLFAVESGGDTEVRQRTGATTSTLVHTFTGTGKRVTFRTSTTDFVILACEDNTYQKYDGTATATINPPAEMDTGVIEVHDGRIWGSRKDVLNQITFSAVQDEDDFSSQDNFGNITMRMPKVVAIASIGNAGMIVCDEFFTSLITGDGFQSYGQLELSKEFGCKARRTMVSFGNFALWLSHEGVIAASEAGLEKVSLPKEDLFDGLTDAQLETATAFKYREFYVLCYDDDEDGVNDKSVVFDTRYGIWVTDLTQPFSVGTETSDRKAYIGKHDEGIIFQYDNGTDDDGTAIAMKVKTRGFDFGRFFADKVHRRAYLQSNKTGSANLAVQAIVDDVNVGAAQNYDVNDGENSLAMPDSGRGSILQYEMTNSTGGDAIELRSIVIIAEEYPARE